MRSRCGNRRRCIRKAVSGNGTVASGIDFIYDGCLQIAAFEAINAASDADATNGVDMASGIRVASSTGGTDSVITTLWDPTEQTATRPLAMRQNGEIFFHAHDLTKNITALVDANGGMAESYDYDAFGNPAITRHAPGNQPANHAASVANNRFLFSSECHDSETGLSHYNFRHYNPMDGRWTSRDPLREKSFDPPYNTGTLQGIEHNSYSFANNSPVAVFDVLGLSFITDSACWCCTKLIGAETLARLLMTGIDGRDDPGGGNAFRHCLAACRSARACGHDCAVGFWDGRENAESTSGSLDLANNQIDYEMACLKGECYNNCANAWKHGRLVCPNGACPPPPSRTPPPPPCYPTRPSPYPAGLM